MFQGEIVLIRFPFSNMVDYKIRPAIIISNDKFNQYFDSWLCPITSVLTAQGEPINKYLEEGNLDKLSYAKTTVLFSISSDLILKKVGKLSKQKTKEIIEEIKLNF
jgi:mRNA interferase MazF